LKYPNPV